MLTLNPCTLLQTPLVEVIYNSNTYWSQYLLQVDNKPVSGTHLNGPNKTLKGNIATWARRRIKQRIKRIDYQIAVLESLQAHKEKLLKALEELK